ncbi:MAG: MerR family DNA-binding transcriptional regulator [Dehalococcoidia bacterium]|nr:MerR family DNA-binding transcriptional regulator [Dehalococcoidia bacterium]
MMRIGHFSRLSRVPIKTLRYYDELGLINSAHVDEFNGYRYYTYEQYLHLNRLTALKDGRRNSPDVICQCAMARRVVAP